MLNFQNKEVVSELEDHLHGETNEVTKEELEKAVWKLCNEVVAELLKNGGEVVIDWLTEVIQHVAMEVWKDSTGMERCNTDPY